MNSIAYIKKLVREDSLPDAELEKVDSALAKLALNNELNMVVAGSFPLLHLAIKNNNLDLVKKLLSQPGIDVNQEINVSEWGRTPRKLTPIELAAQIPAPRDSNDSDKKVNIIFMLHGANAKGEWRSRVGRHLEEKVDDLLKKPVPVAEETEEYTTTLPYDVVTAVGPAVAVSPGNLRKSSSSSSSGDEAEGVQKRRRRRTSRRRSRTSRRRSRTSRRRSRTNHRRHRTGRKKRKHKKTRGKKKN